MVCCRDLAAWLVLAMTALALGWSTMTRAGDRPAGAVGKTRSVVLAREGLACTSQPLATQAALQVLREGGNAIDAAIAANAVLAVTEPMSCGPGGDLFAIVYDAKTRRLHGLNASGRAPRRATIAHFRGLGLERIPTEGPLSWSVPGCVSGWDELRRRFGSQPMAKLLAPAIHYAESGFGVSEIIAADWAGEAPSLAKIPSSAACYLPGGRAPRTGELFRNPDLAATLRQIVDGGAEAFYRGAIAARLADYSASVGGLLTAEDLAGHTSEWVEPVSTNYRGYDVWQLPPNSQGIAVLQMLNILEGYDLKALGPNSAQAIHLMVEAKKLVYEDRARYYADPSVARVPIATLISKAYAARRRQQIDPERASTDPQPGAIPEADTVYLTVADGQGNVISLIQSVFHGFGSKHVPTGLGFALQNRGCLFALDETHANRLEPGKRPFQTIIPGFVTKDGEPWLSFGVMGGDMQPQGQVQALCNLIDFGLDVQEAGEAPRWRHLGSSEPTGVAGQPGGGELVTESGISEAVLRDLTRRGHRLGEAARGGFGGYQAIRVDPRSRVLQGGSDPRKDGMAAGY